MSPLVRAILAAGAPAFAVPIPGNIECSTTVVSRHAGAVIGLG
jgi:hypothetical protein